MSTNRVQNIDLLPSQRNAVLAVISNAELDPFNFEWSRAASDLVSYLHVPRLAYNGTSYFFKFDFQHGLHHFSFCPGDDVYRETGEGIDWGGQLRAVARWIRNLQREIHEPDLWTQLARYQLPSTARVDVPASNEPFSAAQADRIATALEQVKAYFEEIKDSIEYSSETRLLVNQKLDYLAEAARRQGRMDWFHTAIGVVVSFAVSVQLPLVHLQSIWKFIVAGLRGAVPMILP